MPFDASKWIIPVRTIIEHLRVKILLVLFRLSFSSLLYKRFSFLQANPPLVRPHKPIKSNKNDLEVSVLGLHFVVSSQHFINGRLKVTFLFRFILYHDPCHSLALPFSLSNLRLIFVLQLIEWESFSFCSLVADFPQSECPCKKFSICHRQPFNLTISTHISWLRVDYDRAT